MRPISLLIVPEPHWRGLAGALSQGNPWFPHGPPPCACLSKNHFEAPAGRSPAPPPIPCDPSASSSSPSPTGEVWRERREFPLAHLFHHLLHLLAGGHQLVYLLYRRPAALGDSQAAPAVDHVGHAAL